MYAGHGLQIRANYVCGSRITNPRQRCVRVTDYKSAPAMCAGHGLQIRASDVWGHGLQIRASFSNYNLKTISLE
jgi:hypothetical protein